MLRYFAQTDAVTMAWVSAVIFQTALVLAFDGNINWLVCIALLVVAFIAYYYALQWQRGVKRFLIIVVRNVPEQEIHKAFAAEGATVEVIKDD